MECVICGVRIEGKSDRFCSPRHAKVWRQRKYRQDNKDKINAYKRKYWKERKRISGYFERFVRPKFMRENDACLKCGTKEDIQVHHIRSLGNGGDNKIGNLMTLCRKHHREFEKLTEGFFK